MEDDDKVRESGKRPVSQAGRVDVFIPSSRDLPGSEFQPGQRGSKRGNSDTGPRLMGFPVPHFLEGILPRGEHAVSKEQRNEAVMCTCT